MYTVTEFQVKIDRKTPTSSKPELKHTWGPVAGANMGRLMMHDLYDGAVAELQKAGIIFHYQKGPDHCYVASNIMEFHWYLKELETL